MLDLNQEFESLLESTASRQAVIVSALDDLDWGYDYDADASFSEGQELLVVYLFDPDSQEVLDSVGGVDVDFQISDHGNVNVSPEGEVYLKQIAEEMASARHGASKVGEADRYQETDWQFVDSLLIDDAAPLGVQPGFESARYKAYKYAPDNRTGPGRSWAVVTDPDDLDGGWLAEGLSMKQAFESANSWNRKPFLAPDHSQFHDPSMFGLIGRKTAAWPPEGFEVVEHTQLQVGDVVYQNRNNEMVDPATILRPAEEGPDPVIPGATAWRYWAGSEDGREGYLTFGPGGVVHRKTAIKIDKDFIKKWLLTHWTNDEGEVNCLLANPENWRHIEAMGEHYRSQRWGEDEELVGDDMGVDESLGWALTGLIEGGHEPPAGGHLPGCPYAPGGRYAPGGQWGPSAKKLGFWRRIFSKRVQAEFPPQDEDEGGNDGSMDGPPFPAPGKTEYQPHGYPALPSEIGMPKDQDVAAENPHGTNWEMVESGDQGVQAEPYDRFFARYQSDEGYIADYFYLNGQWGLGAN